MVKKSARRTRRTHTPALKAQVAVAAFREDRTLAELGQPFRAESHADRRMEATVAGARRRSLWRWRPRGRAGGPGAAARQDRPAGSGAGLSGRSAHQSWIAERKTMIDRDHHQTVTPHAEPLAISRGSVYYRRAR